MLADCLNLNRTLCRPITWIYLSGWIKLPVVNRLLQIGNSCINHTIMRKHNQEMGEFRRQDASLKLQHLLLPYYTHLHPITFMLGEQVMWTKHQFPKEHWTVSAYYIMPILTRKLQLHGYTRSHGRGQAGWCSIAFSLPIILTW